MGILFKDTVCKPFKKGRLKYPSGYPLGLPVKNFLSTRQQWGNKGNGFNMGIDIIMVVLLILFHTLTSGYLCSKVGNQCIMYGNNKRWMMKIPLNIDKPSLKYLS